MLLLLFCCWFHVIFSFPLMSVVITFVLWHSVEMRPTGISLFRDSNYRAELLQHTAHHEICSYFPACGILNSTLKLSGLLNKVTPDLSIGLSSAPLARGRTASSLTNATRLAAESWERMYSWSSTHSTCFLSAAWSWLLYGRAWKKKVTHEEDNMKRSLTRHHSWKH